MRWGSGIGTGSDFDRAIDIACATVKHQLGEGAADLALIFAAPYYIARFDDLIMAVADRYPGAHIVGCMAGGVIGDQCEVERRPALSLLVGRLPDVQIDSFSLREDELAQLADQADAEAWSDAVGAPLGGEVGFVLLTNPFNCDVRPLIDGLERAWPGAPIVGGVSSGQRQQMPRSLFGLDVSPNAAVVGLALRGNVTLDTIVAQGCRPIGQPMFATRVADNVIFELDGQPAADVLSELFTSSTREVQEQISTSLAIGLGMRGGEQRYALGDYLVRNIIGLDSAAKSLSVGAFMRPNTVVQFHVRDSGTSAAELEHLLRSYEASSPGSPAGALLFSCLGRGELFYGAKDHDTAMFHAHLGEVPMAGFFCNGEIGPVHGHTYLHGYTSSFGILRPKE